MENWKLNKKEKQRKTKTDKNNKPRKLKNRWKIKSYLSKELEILDYFGKGKWKNKQIRDRFGNCN